MATFTRTATTAFEYLDADRAMQKINTFIHDGPDLVHVVTDFDLTLTAGKTPGNNVGTWDVLDELMPPEGVRRHKAIYDSFRPLELAGQLTPQIAAEKWAETMDLITSYPISLQGIRKAFLAVAELRSGADTLFTHSATAGIPIVILSSGIRDVIVEMTDHYGLKPDFIISNSLVTDNTGTVTGWDRQKLVHMLNKSEHGHRTVSGLRRSRPNVILLGDVPDDSTMVAGDDVLRIRVVDPRAGEQHVPEALVRESIAAGYDMLTNHSLLPVAELIRAIANSDS